MSRSGVRSWRSVLGIVLVVALVVGAGCASRDGGSAAVETPTYWDQSDRTASPTPTVAPPREYPEPPAEVTNETATAAALDYEEVYVYNRLRKARHSEWGVRGWHSTSSTVLDHADGGVYVRVTMPYSFQFDAGYADMRSEATYFVSEAEIRRVEGTDITTEIGPSFGRSRS